TTAKRLVAKKPEDVSALALLSEACVNLKKYDEALQIFDLLQQLSTNKENYEFNKAFCYFHQGDWVSGWDFYENRIAANTSNDYQEHPNTRWSGEDLTGKRVLVLPEQGIGDNIQMFRYVQVLREKCAQILFPKSANLKFVVEQVFKPEEILPEPELREGQYDYYIYTMSLPKALGIHTPQAASKLVPYLQLPAAKATEWKQKLSALKGLKVGVVWGGNPKSGNDPNRSLDGRLYRRLAEIPGVQLVALQYREGRYPLILEERDFFSYDAGREVGPWEDFAGAVAACDVFISIDTSGAHLAGSLGLPTWLLLPWNADFRWSTSGGESSPWYSNHRLFRCPDINDWPNLLEEVAEKLTQQVQMRGINADSIPTLQQLQSNFNYSKNANIVLETNEFNKVVKGKHGYFICNEFDRIIGRSLIKYGEFAESTVDFYKSVLYHECVAIEVGSFFGNHTVPLAHLVGKMGKVYSFEAIKAFYYMLCGNIAMNSLTQIEAHNLPIGDEERQILISDLQLDRNFNYGAIDIRKFPLGEPARLTTLDAFFMNRPGYAPLKRLDLLVADVNGMEAEVLTGAKQLIQKFQPYLYLGSNFQPFTPKTIQTAWELDYNVYWHVPRMFNPKNDANVAENIFEGKVLVNLIGIHKKHGFHHRLPLVKSALEYPHRKS
ncbi:MAG: FkbM family methyltransferase, partial [Sumerlaeia bacterium]